MTNNAKDPDQVLNSLLIKNVPLEPVIQESQKNKNLLKEILKGLKSKNEDFRYNCSKVLSRLTEDHPELVYPEWDYLLSLLKSPNSYHRISATTILANLAKADTENKFEEIFDYYFGLLQDTKFIVAMYVLLNAGKIARAKPDLMLPITEILFNTDDLPHEHKDLLKANVIISFSEFYDISPDRERIINFVKEELKSTSGRTRKEAEKFLREISD